MSVTSGERFNLNPGDDFGVVLTGTVFALNLNDSNKRNYVFEFS